MLDTTEPFLVFSFLILCEFHIMYFNPLHLPLIPTLHPCSLSPTEKKNLTVEAVVCHSYGSCSVFHSTPFCGIYFFACKSSLQ